MRLLDAIYQDFLFGDVVAGGLLEKTGARIDSLVLRTATAEYAVAGSVPLLWLDPGWRLDMRDEFREMHAKRARVEEYIAREAAQQGYDRGERGIFGSQEYMTGNPADFSGDRRNPSDRGK